MRPARYSIPAWVGLLLLAASFSGAAEALESDSPPVPEKVGRSMQDRSYAEAVAAIDEAAKAGDAPKDYLAYLKGRALTLAEQYDDAAAAFDNVEKQFPESRWVRRARFAKAVALARKGDFRGAELIYRAEAEWLLSADRKHEIAEIYLEFADAYFKPPKEDDEPDYAKALEFYNKALEAGPKPEKRVEVELAVARCHQELGKLDEAEKRYAKLSEDHPESPLAVEARYRLGECYLAEKRWEDARRAWEDLLARYPDSDSERIAEAAFRLSRTWRIPEPEDEQDLSRGAAALEAFLKRFPAHKLAGQAYLDLAKSYLRRGQADKVPPLLGRFLGDGTYRDREEIADARALLARTYQVQRKWPEALAAWKDYLTKHPAHKMWEWGQRQLVEIEYQMGLDRFEAKDYETARTLWSEFLAEHPLDARNAEILFHFGRIDYEEKKWDDAIAQWRRVVSKYPGMPAASQAQLRIAATLELKLGRLEEAIKEYRKVPWGNESDEAAQAITRLTSKTLTVSTDRVFRSDEPPRIKLVTRNVESVTVRVYQVDLETYFRKMHLAEGVESLDISLIDPDQTLDYAVPDYAEYQQFERSIELPVPGGVPATGGTGSAAGGTGSSPARDGAARADKPPVPPACVMAVTVSSKTLEATTLVIRSDLDIIAKSSRDEVFVFAENMRTGKPWPGVRLLISDGNQVFAEAATGADGVLRQAYPELKQAGDVRVFAVADGHVASNVVGLEGVGVAQGLSDKGYIYTDRPAYRAGETVSIRGCIRRVAGGTGSSPARGEPAGGTGSSPARGEPARADKPPVPPGEAPELQAVPPGDRYLVEPGSQYTLAVLDSRNRLLRQEKVALGPFGGFHTQFTLPPTCPQGACRVLVRNELGQSYQGSFLVQEFELEPVQLTVDTPRRVYYRGEQIEGVIRARFYYGAPLAGREIRYQLAGERVYTARTDEKGEVHFRLETRPFAESRVLPLEVTLAERNLTHTENFVLATQGFTVDVSSVRPVYVAGESFETTVRTSDAAGEPVGRKLSLKVLERTTVDGKVSERLVEEHALETAPADGTARQTLVLASGGDYVLRAEGTDRFGNAIWGELSLTISGDQDQVRLRILADRHTYKSGETAEVTLHWREQPALALVTFQGARVLGYRLVELATGANKLSLPMTPELAPNFELNVAVMTDPRAKEGEPADEKPRQRFHEASSPFDVERELAVSIARRRADGGDGPVRPGEEVEVTLTTTDPQGKPVPAELSLAMVEQSLLDRFEWPAPPIQEFFRGSRREPAVRTTSSITFAYHPTTRPINPRLLSEQERIQIAQEEATSLQKVPATGGAWGLGGSMGGMGGMGGAGGSGGGMGGMGGGYFGGPLGAGHGVGGPAPGKEPEEAEDPFGLTPEVVEQEPEGEKPAATQADFDSLVGLITPKVKPESWGETATAPASPGAGKTTPLADQPTGYWNPAIVTGEDGKATVRFRMPERSTAWKLLAKGITVDTLAGEADTDLVVRDDLFGQLKLPLAFTEGDQAQVLVAVHNAAVEKGPIEVTLKTTIDGRSVEEKKTIEAAAKGIHELSFAASLSRPEPSAEQAAASGGPATVAFELTVSAGDRRHVTRRTVPLRPYGVPVFATAGGSAEADTTAWVDPPAGVDPRKASLQILVGPTVEQSLLDAVLGASPWCQAEMERMGSGLESTASDLMASLSLQSLLRTTRGAAGPQAAELDERIRTAIGVLVSSQNDGGGWSWAGRGAQSDRYVTARIVWAASLARAAGYPVPDGTFNQATSYLAGQLTATAENDFESKAILLHALTAAAKPDFPLANRLYRDRPSLSTAALAYLSLTFAAMDRKQTAQELLDLVAKRNLDQPVSRRESADGTLPWSCSPAELRALYALAVQEASPESPEAKTQVDWLLAHRMGNRWSPDKATGPAMAALCRWFARSRFEGEHYRLTVLVNDVKAGVLEVDPASGTQQIDVPRAALAEGKQRIVFQLTGRGRYAYQCILASFVPAEQAKSTTEDWTVQRVYEPAPLEVDGREIPRGFDLVEGEHATFRNPLTQLPVGRRGIVTLTLRRRAPAATPDEDLDYLVVTEPIPSGAAVVEKSIAGAFDRYEITPGAIVFYVGNRRSPGTSGAAAGTIRYELYGYLPGAYRAGPTVVRSAYRPERMAVAQPEKLAVLPSGAQGSDEYRLTPRELYELGKQQFARGDLKAAQEYLADLFDHWKLDSGVYKDVVTMLLDVHLELGPPAQVVRFFEIVMEKWPEEQIPFRKSLAIAAAYHEMGEYERSYLAFRATVEASFVRDGGVAGFVDSQGEFLRSVDVMQRLVREYPPEPYVAAASYGLAQRVSAKAPQAADDPKLRAEKVNRVDLLRRAGEMFETFLTEYPEDPAADQAAFAKANVLLSLKAFDQVIAACGRYAERYPKSKLLDTYWYMIGYCQFSTGRAEEALQTCRKVAEATHVDPSTGQELPSRNKWQAIFILGQIYHSLGRAAEAIAEYRRVEDRFDDARKSIAYFLRKDVTLPEVTTVRPGKPVEVELAFRNLAACDVKVYRIDLVKFGLLRPDLSDVTGINLAGIRPLNEQSIELGDGLDYRDRTRAITLPLAEEGAYLVVCRGGELHASGLVLVTPLAVEVQADADAGQVRATVKDVVADRYVAGVEVKVIGSGNQDFVAGQTDLRGVFVANGIQGSPTVMADAGSGRYAFFRSPAASGQPAEDTGESLAQAVRVESPEKYRAMVLSSTPSENEKRIFAALDSPTAFDFKDTPLADVIDYLKKFHGIEIQLDRKAMDDVGVAPDVPVTKSLRGISLRSALKLLLKELDLTFEVRDEALLITTPEEAENHLTTVAYPVTDLVRCRDKSGETWNDFDSLIDTITTTVAPESWDSVGGPGSIAPMQVGDTDVITLSQTQEVHRQIAALLAKMRALAGLKGENAEPPVREKPQYGAGSQGYGGFGGGFGGGMGMGMGSGRPQVISVIPVDQAGDALLQGLNEANKEFQGKQLEEMNQMYQRGGMGGMGGVGAGGFF